MNLGRFVLAGVLCVPSAACYEGLQQPIGVAEMQVPQPSPMPEPWRVEAAANARYKRRLELYGRARTAEMTGRCEEARVAYRDYASFVRDEDPASAEMAMRYAALCRPRARVDPRNTAAVNALLARDYSKVLLLTEGPAEPPAAAWLDLDRAAALSALDRIDEAASTYGRAARRFADTGDNAGYAAALWGAAHTFDEAGRCVEAKRAYDDYAQLVRPTDPRGALMAASYGAECRPIVTLR